MYSSRPTLALTVFCGLVGLVSGLGLAQFKIPGYQSMGALASGVALSFAAFAWFRSDAIRRAYRRSKLLNIAFVGLPVVMLPYYLVKSRGRGAGLRAIGVALLIYVIYVFATVLGIAIVRVTPI